MAVIIIHWVICLVGAFITWFLVEIGGMAYDSVVWEDKDGKPVEEETPCWYHLLKWIKWNVPAIFYLIIFGCLALVWDGYITINASDILSKIISEMPDFRLF